MVYTVNIQYAYDICISWGISIGAFAILSLGMEISYFEKFYIWNTILWTTAYTLVISINAEQTVMEFEK